MFTFLSLSFEYGLHHYANGGSRCASVVQCDRVAMISVVRIIFPVLRKEDGVVVDKYDESSSHPHICDTEA